MKSAQLNKKKKEERYKVFIVYSRVIYILIKKE